MKIKVFSFVLMFLVAVVSAFAHDNATSAPVAKSESEANKDASLNQKSAEDSVWNTFFPEGLIDVQGNPVDVSTLQGKIVGLYFSAHWCPPCRAFSPKLVEFRDANADKFEVVFISSDENLDAQLNYMKELNMKWPAVKHGTAAANALAEKYGVQGIPTLIILSPKGETISTSGRAEVQNSPDTCLSKWLEKVK